MSLLLTTLFISSIEVPGRPRNQEWHAGSEYIDALMYSCSPSLRNGPLFVSFNRRLLVKS